MAVESWFRSLWKVPRRHDSGHEKEFVGVLAFEVASLMSKLVDLWKSLSDKQISKLREEIRTSVGIKKLVSEDEEFIAHLICSELIDSMVHVAKSVVRLAKKCSDSSLKSFEHFFEDLIQASNDPYGWGFTWKKMDKKVKKMERFISINGTLYQEMELLGDLEQTVRRMKNNDPEPDNLLEYQKKLVWKKQELKNLREISLWNKTHDYVILLLARSLFTIFNRINDIFGIHSSGYSGDSKIQSSDHTYHSQSVATLFKSPAPPAESGRIPRFASGPLGRFTEKSGPDSKPNENQNYFSGSLRDSTTMSGPLSDKNTDTTFFSGPLGKPSSKTGPISGIYKSTKKMWQNPQTPFRRGRKPSGPNRSTQVGPFFKGCMVSGDGSFVASCYFNSATDISGDAQRIAAQNGLSINSPCKLLKTLPETLGAAALALHYANVIIVIEKLAASPHLIGHDARDDLYMMLPANVRSSLRARLKPYSKSLASSVYDTVLAKEWTDAMASILEWLAPLAHNMIRWQSERSFEQQSFVSRTNVLLVQTLYFANQEKTEAIITELLVGLNYVWRFSRELNAKALRECASNGTFDEYLELDK